MEHEGTRRYWFLYSVADVIFITFLIIILTQAAALLTGADVVFHIKIGDYIIDNLSIPSHDIFTHAEPLPAWTPPAWLADVILALAAKPFGLTGVVVFVAILIAAIFAIFFNFLRSTNISVLLAALMTIFAAGVSTVHWLPRPHIFSLLFLLLWYIILNTYQYKQKNYLYLLPVLVIFWVNVHGSFALGFVLLAIYAIGNLLIGRFKPEEQGDASRRAKSLILLFIVCLVAALFNPQGYNILATPFHSLTSSSVVEFIQEWGSPDFHDFSLYELMLLVMIVVLGVSVKRLNIIEIALVVLFTHMSLFAGRFIPLYAIIVTPIIARHVEHLLRNAKDNPISAEILGASERMAVIDANTKGNLWSIATIVVVITLCFTGHLRYQFDRSKMPVEAVEFLKRESIPGQMFNSDVYGSYIIYETWPQYDVFIDGRYVQGEKRMQDYSDVVFIKRNWEEVLNKYAITWIIYRNESALSNLLMERDDWPLIYSDETANIFVKRIPANQQLIDKFGHVTRAGVQN